MKINIFKKHFEIVPETPQDEAYLEHISNLQHETTKIRLHQRESIDIINGRIMIYTTSEDGKNS